MGNLNTNFGIYGTMRSRLMGQHLSDAPCDIATLTFDLGGRGACWWYKSSYSIYLSSLKFVGLSVQKIWCTSDLSISRRGDLDLWPWNWCALLPVGWATCLAIFGISRTFRSRLMGQHLSVDGGGWRDLATLTFDLGGHGACRWYRSSYTKFEIWSLKFVGLRFRIYCVNGVLCTWQHSINF